ncbi:MAG: class I SAM-dependent methyltransferase [Schwartzia sp.]|nr:class I SAM-dependent methyltransferase [Schwartzia sp. (in: firmicutes)]
MNDWNDGYFTESTYTYGYYRELNPVFQSFCLLAKGYCPPKTDSGSVHCELGFGQGVSAAIHAAASPGQYFGTDFNPAHAAHANTLREAAGINARFFDDSFAEMLERSDLPQFDTISLHGIWSWISRENQQHITEFARRFLKPGGVFYNSYNCMPGWAAKAPLRELFVLHDKYGQPGATAQKRVEEAMKFTEALLAAKPLYAQQNSVVTPAFEGIRKHDHHYLAHEYFNRDWHCMYFTEMLEALSPAKLEFACSAAPLNVVENYCLPPAALEYLATIENPVIREQARDYFINQQFRKDIYVRGLRPLSVAERVKRILDMRYVLSTTKEIPLTIPVPVGKIAVSEEVYGPLLAYLRENNGQAKSIAEFTRKHRNIPAAQFVQALIVLVENEWVTPCQSEENEKRVKKQCDALNNYIINRSLLAGDVGILASPVTGGGVGLGRVDLMSLLFYRQGKKTAAAIADALWAFLSSRGEKMIFEQKQLETPEENIAMAKELSQDFMAKTLPLLRALQVV